MGQPGANPVRRSYLSLAPLSTPEMRFRPVSTAPCLPACEQSLAACSWPFFAAQNSPASTAWPTRGHPARSCSALDSTVARSATWGLHSGLPARPSSGFPSWTCIPAGSQHRRRLPPAEPAPTAPFPPARGERTYSHRLLLPHRLRRLGPRCPEHGRDAFRLLHKCAARACGRGALPGGAS